MNPSIQSRRYGCAIGAALGDAFGMPLEFGPAIPETRLVRTLTPGRLSTGTITDDTEMALALAESLATRKPLDPADLAQRFLDWYHSNPPDIGGHTANTMRHLAKGLPWDQAAARTQAEHPGSAGNGSLMRCWPVAVAYWDQRELLFSESALQSNVTHQHEDCIAACIFTNLLIAELISGVDLRQACQSALQGAAYPAWVESVLLAAPTRRREELPNTGWVRHTLAAALWAVLSTSSYSEAVIQAANLGDDADTTAAVAGAIAGAAYGLEAIPPAWRANLRALWPPQAPKEWREPDFLALIDRL